VRSEYYISDVEGKTISTCGQVLLSRHPFQGFIYTFSPKKNIITGRFFLNSRDFVVPVIHLTSDHEKYGPNSGATKRGDQLDLLNDLFSLNLLSGDFPKEKKGDGLIMGDFNIGDESVDESVEISGFSDLWKVFSVINCTAEKFDAGINFRFFSLTVFQDCNPEDPGYTFDTAVNPLAAITSKKGARRLDRVLLKSLNWECAKILMFGNVPKKIEAEIVCEGSGGEKKIEKREIDIYPSDHYGLFFIIQKK
jgi:hypothetical protein